MKQVSVDDYEESMFIITRILVGIRSGFLGYKILTIAIVLTPFFDYNVTSEILYIGQLVAGEC
jgi:hypothetical protein